MRLRVESIAWREVEGEILAVDRARGQYIAANAAAAQLWPLLAAGCTREALVDRLVEAFGIAQDLADRDVEVFLGDLRERALLDEQPHRPEAGPAT